MGMSGHAACCINYGEQHPQLLVTGGRDKDGKTLRDAWLLDVDSGTWKEVCMQVHRAVSGVHCVCNLYTRTAWTVLSAGIC